MVVSMQGSAAQSDSTSGTRTDLAVLRPHAGYCPLALESLTCCRRPKCVGSSRLWHCLYVQKVSFRAGGASTDAQESHHLVTAHAHGRGRQDIARRPDEIAATSIEASATLTLLEGGNVRREYSPCSCQHCQKVHICRPHSRRDRPMRVIPWSILALSLVLGCTLLLRAVISRHQASPVYPSYPPCLKRSFYLARSCQPASF